MSWITQKYGQIAGGIGRGIDIAGKLSGNRAPELGLSEALEQFGGMFNPRQVQASEPVNYNRPDLSSQQYYTPGGGQPQGDDGGIKQVAPPSPGPQDPGGQDIREGDINRQAGDFQAMVDRDYETTMSGIAGEEKGFREQAGTAESKIKAQYGTAKTSIGEELATRETGLAGEEQTAATSAKTAQQEARDMFREIQQQNIAQLSGLGISSSSVSEALAERLGVETARRIGGVTGTFNEIKQNIAKEKTRIQTYYKQRVTDLEENMAVGIKEIQDSLMGGLRQISQARTVAATDKANQRTEIWSRAQTALAGLKADAQDFAQSLEEWERKRSTSLQSVEQDPNFLANLQAGAATFAQDPAFSQFNFAPQAALSSKGQWSGQIKSTPKEEDLYANEDDFKF